MTAEPLELIFQGSDILKDSHITKLYQESNVFTLECSNLFYLQYP